MFRRSRARKLDLDGAAIVFDHHADPHQLAATHDDELHHDPGGSLDDQYGPDARQGGRDRGRNLSGRR